MKTIISSAVLAVTLVSGAALASPETAHNGIPVLSTAGQPYVSGGSPADAQLALNRAGTVNASQSNDPARNANTSK